MKVLVLFLQYDTEKYPYALHYFKKYLTYINEHEITILTIDNKNEKLPFTKLSKNEYIIGGDNTLWEFSGWQKGVECLNSNEINYDCIIFANDSFLAPAGGSSDLSGIINNQSINESYYTNSLIGELVGKDTNAVIFGCYIKDYIRTHCFIMPKELVQKLNSIPTIGIDALNQCIDETYQGKYFKDDAPISKNFQKMWVNHIKTYWHSRIKPEDNWELYRMKTLAVLNEIFLTVRVRGGK